MNDLEIARIGAALAVLGQRSELAGEPPQQSESLKAAAEDFLKRQFAPPEPAPTVSRAPKQPDTRCTKIIPGRGSLKREDAIRCSREMGHEGPCDFGNG